jgi:hypothetical protein
MKPYVRSIHSAMGVESKLKRWTMCKRGFAIGHMYYAHPTLSERYYLRMLLNCVKGATSYEHLWIVWMAQSTTHSKMHALQWVCL